MGARILSLKILCGVLLPLSVAISDDLPLIFLMLFTLEKSTQTMIIFFV